MENYIYMIGVLVFENMIILCDLICWCILWLVSVQGDSRKSLYFVITDFGVEG